DRREARRLRAPHHASHPRHQGPRRARAAEGARPDAASLSRDLAAVACAVGAARGVRVAGVVSARRARAVHRARVEVARSVCARSLPEAEGEGVAMEQLVAAIVAAVNARSLYPAGHPRVVQAVEAILAALSDACEDAERDSVTLLIVGDDLVFG